MINLMDPDANLEAQAALLVEIAKLNPCTVRRRMQDVRTMSRDNERWLRYQGRGKSKADQQRFIAATKWASEVGPELEAMARKLKN